MLTIVASRWDQTATALANRGDPSEIAVLTADDLATKGWRVHVGDLAHSTAVVGGQIVDAGEVTAVLTLLPEVNRREVPQVVAEEQSYVAAEMNAFLLYWLASLTCPVFNPPATPCLSSPTWSVERLALIAHSLGIPTVPVRRSTSDRHRFPVGSAGDALTLTVVGKDCIGDGDAALVKRAHRLARAAGVEMLSVQFSGPDPDSFLVAAAPWPDISNSQVADAVMAFVARRQGP